MKIFTTTILLGVILTACGPENSNFDPFDKEFSFHKNFNLSDYDTIRGECGYWNLTNRNDGTYYQFFLNENEIVAKGFNLTLDEIIINYPEDLTYNETITNASKNNPIDTNRIKERLKFFEIKKVIFVSDKTQIQAIKMTDQKDSIHFADILPFLDSNKIVWQISYFNGKDR